MVVLFWAMQAAGLLLNDNEPGCCDWMEMEQIDKIAGWFIDEAQDDYVGLWAIAPTVRRELGLAGNFSLSNNEEVKARTLDVVRILLDKGLLAGDFDYANSEIHFWDERDPEAVIARIDREWDPAKGDPPLPESICWFAFQTQ